MKNIPAITIFTLDFVEWLAIIEHHLTIYNKKSAARSNGFLRFYTLVADLRQMQTLDIFAQIKNRRKCVIFGWSSWIRTSGMTESKSVALPLGYTPFFRKCCLRQTLVYHNSRKKSSVFSLSKKITDFFGYFHRKCRFSLAKSIFLWYNYDNIIANQHANQRHCPHITRIS